jgi:hypothetical protein
MVTVAGSALERDHAEIAKREHAEDMTRNVIRDREYRPLYAQFSKCHLELHDLGSADLEYQSAWSAGICRLFSSMRKQARMPASQESVRDLNDRAFFNSWPLCRERDSLARRQASTISTSPVRSPIFTSRSFSVFHL